VVERIRAVRYPSWGQSAATTAADWPPRGVERPRRKVGFARLLHRRVRALGGPSARAAFGGNLSLTWKLLRLYGMGDARWSLLVDLLTARRR
jgi:hypothetical protein